MLAKTEAVEFLDAYSWIEYRCNKEIFLKHIRQNGSKGTPFKELQQVLLGHSRDQIQVLMRELRKEKRAYWCRENKSCEMVCSRFAGITF